MPFHIDRFRGSPEVQAMQPAARIGFLYLLASAWQTDDCSLSSDPIDLATESGLGDDLWAQYGPRILRKFELIEGRYRNQVLFDEWEDSRKKFEKNHGPTLTPEQLSEVKSKAGKQGAIKRWQKDGKAIAEAWQKDGLQEQEQVQEQSTKTLASTAIAVPAGKLVCTLPLNHGDHEVFDFDVQQWVALYPAVDVRQELRNIKGWLIASPQRRKTKRGIARFINSWMSRTQNEAKPTGGGNGNRNHGKTAGNLDALEAANRFARDQYSEASDDLGGEAAGAGDSGYASDLLEGSSGLLLEGH